MDPQPFFIEYLYKDNSEIAEVKPCCEQDNAFYYDIYIRNQYQFTVTPAIDEERGLLWKVSLKNADKKIENDLVDVIGHEIDKHLVF